jgi:hypothetical protein
MNIPRFTAEASLTKGIASYHGAGEALLDSAILQLAESHSVYRDHSGLGLFHPGLGNCLKCLRYSSGWGDLLTDCSHWVVGWC